MTASSMGAVGRQLCSESGRTACFKVHQKLRIDEVCEKSFIAYSTASKEPASLNFIGAALWLWQLPGRDDQAGVR